MSNGLDLLDSWVTWAVIFLIVIGLALIGAVWCVRALVNVIVPPDEPKPVLVKACGCQCMAHDPTTPIQVLPASQIGGTHV